MTKKTFFNTVAATALLFPVLGMADESPWDFKLKVFAKWDDNRDAVPSHLDKLDPYGYEYEKEDSLNLGAQFTAAFDTYLDARNFVRFSYSPIYNYWDNPRVGGKSDEWSHYATAKYKYTVDSRSYFELKDEFRYTHDDFWYLTDADQERTRNNDKRLENEQEHMVNYVEADYSREVTKLDTLRLLAGWRTVAYKDDEISDREDEDQFRVHARWLHGVSARASLGLYARYHSYMYGSKTVDDVDGEIVSTSRDLQSLSGGISGQYRVSERLVFNANCGVEQITYDADSIDDRTSVEGGLDMTYETSADTRFSAGFDYSTVDGWVYPYASQDLSSFYAAFRCAHTENFSTDYRVAYKLSEYDTDYIPEENRKNYADVSDGERTELVLRANANYRWNNGVTLTGYVEHINVDSDVSYEYDRNLVGASATYKF